MYRKKVSEISRAQLKRRIGLYPILRQNQLEPESRESEVRENTPLLEIDTPEANTDEYGRVPGNKNEEVVSQISSDTDSKFEYNLRPKNTLKYDLAQWSLKHNIPINATSALLHLLSRHYPEAELPLDGRTLLETPRETSVIKMTPGEYCHFGLIRGLKVAIEKMNRLQCDSLRLQINVDGLPISKSSGKQFWPILCSISNVRGIEPFPVGIYFGNTKPESSNDLMAPFVDEFSSVSQNGIDMQGRVWSAVLEAFICDAPAKSFIKCTKGHSGYSSCGSCKIVGEYVENRVVFSGIDFEQRTDVEFRREIDHLSEDTHKVGTSILETLPIDMVKQFPHDYMHLVCLGVTKKLLLLWLRGRDKRYKLSNRQVEEISLKLEASCPNICKEFSRKSRSLREVDRWKATEFRLFLLYTGPVVLKNIIDGEVFHHFLALHLAIRILCSDMYLKFKDYAKNLLTYFVQTFQSIYGKSQMSFNIHGLLHLSDDSRNYGPLDKFSAFKFENKLGEFKKLLKSSRSPLQQIHRRISEKSNLLQAKVSSGVECRNPHNRDALTKSLQGYSQYDQLALPDFTLTTSGADAYCITRHSSVIRIMNILKKDKVILLRGEQFRVRESLYSVPTDSAKFGLFQCSGQLQAVTFGHEEISCKCLALPIVPNSYAIFPILHSLHETPCSN